MYKEKGFKCSFCVSLNYILQDFILTCHSKYEYYLNLDRLRIKEVLYIMGAFFHFTSLENKPHYIINSFRIQEL